MKRIAIFAAFILILTSCFGASANTVSEFDFGMSEEDIPLISVSGALDGERSGFSLVNYQVLYCGDIIDDIEGAYAQACEKLQGFDEKNDMTDIMSHFGITLTDGDGKYGFSWRQTEQSGIYALMIYTENSDEPYCYIYTYLNPEELKALLGKLSVADSAELESLIDENFRKLNLDMAVYDTLNKSEVCNLMVSLRDDKLDSLSELNGIFTSAVSIQQFNEAENASEIKALCESKNGIFDVGTSVFYPTFEKQSDEVKNEVYASLTGKSFKSSEEIGKAFSENGFLTVNAAISHWSAMREFITGNAGWLELDTKEYEKSEAIARAVDKELVKKRFATVEKWKDAFFDAIDDAKNSADEKGTSSKGGSSGGGGGYSGTSLSPITVDSSVTENEVKTEPAVCRFRDMSSHLWAVEAVEALSNKEIISGYEDDSFRPESSVTRAEFVKMAASAFGLVKGGARCSFDDVSKSDWHYDYIAGASRAGVVSGRSENEFCPDETVTRQEMAVILNRTAQYKGIELTVLKEKKSFTDEADIEPYALESVGAMQMSGILEGMEDGSFRPDKTASRAEAAVMIYRMIKFVEG